MDWLVDVFLITLGLAEFILRLTAFIIICVTMFPAVMLVIEGSVDQLTGILKPELWKMVRK